MSGESLSGVLQALGLPCTDVPAGNIHLPARLSLENVKFHLDPQAESYDVSAQVGGGTLTGYIRSQSEWCAGFGWRGGTLTLEDLNSLVSYLLSDLTLPSFDLVPTSLPVTAPTITGLEVFVLAQDIGQLANGDFVVVWPSDNNDASGWSVVGHDGWATAASARATATSSTRPRARAASGSSRAATASAPRAAPRPAARWAGRARRGTRSAGRPSRTTAVRRGR